MFHVVQEAWGLAPPSLDTMTTGHLDHSGGQLSYDDDDNSVGFLLPACVTELVMTML